MEVFGNLNGFFSAEWLESAKMYCGESLTDEMVQQSIHEASDFFHIDDPMIVAEYDTTGVLLNGSGTFNDDILVFSREQMNDMGITGKETFDLVMTHEAAHRMLQGMNTGFDAHQEELCCDFMSGVRAGLNGMDFSGMQESLALSEESDSHPAGISRVYSIKEGADFAEVYRATHGKAPTFQECLKIFKENVGKELVTLREYRSAETTGSIGFADSSLKGFDGDSTESAGGIGFTDTPIKGYDDDSTEAIGSIAFVDGNDSEFKSYTKDEINRNMAKAQKDKSYYESQARHHLSMADHPLSAADRDAHLREARIFLKRADECADEYQKWKWTKPTK